MYDEEDFFGWSPSERPPDPRQADAREQLRAFFEANRDEVFSSRQVEVHFEETFFHWITNRALRDLIAEKLVQTETRRLKFGGEVKLVWHRANRFNRRRAKEVVALIEAYSDPSVGGALGLHGEALVLEGFARLKFVLEGRASNAYGGVAWTHSGHDMDFIFSRDGHAYGVEVKNTLPYMDQKELRMKLRLCVAIGVRPVFAVRMIPQTWMEEIRQAGGRYIILKYQLYPWSHRALAERVESELKLPVKGHAALRIEFRNSAVPRVRTPRYGGAHPPVWNLTSTSCPSRGTAERADGTDAHATTPATRCEASIGEGGDALFRKTAHRITDAAFESKGFLIGDVNDTQPLSVPRDHTHSETPTAAIGSVASGRYAAARRVSPPREAAVTQGEVCRGCLPPSRWREAPLRLYPTESPSR